MTKPFDEAAFRQSLVARGTDPDTATDIARKMAESREERERAKRKNQHAVREEDRLLDLAKKNTDPKRGPVQASTLLPFEAKAASEPAEESVAPKKRARKSAQKPPLQQSGRQPKKPKGARPLPSSAFGNQQLSLFQSFLANTDAQRDALSNAIDLWDSIPRYALTRRKQEELRQPGGYLPIRKVDFQYRSIPLTAVIRPARIEVRDSQGKPTGETIEYYPSAREEMIEQALRRLATDKATGFYDGSEPRSGLYFTLYRLRQELADHGHAMTHRDLAEGLDILSLGGLTIETQSGQDSFELGKFGRSTFLVNLAGVKREDLDRNPDARWYVEFHPLVTASINKIAYRQFNYDRWMRGRSQLCRWLLSQLVLKFTQANIATQFVMKFSTIKRDSGLLDGYKLTRQAVAALDEAWDELKTLDVLASWKKVDERGLRAKLEDVSYTLFPTRTFASEQRASNRRQLEARAASSQGEVQDVEAQP